MTDLQEAERIADEIVNLHRTPGVHRVPRADEVALAHAVKELLEERDRLRSSLQEVKERCADGDPLTSIWNVAQLALNRPPEATQEPEDEGPHRLSHPDPYYTQERET